MAYTSNPKLPRLRMQAVLLVRSGWSIRKVARHLGYSHSTVVRWVAKAPFDGRLAIPTESSRPKSHPRSLAPEVVAAIIDLRLKHGRCGEVIWRQLQRQGVQVSLASVNRTLKRHELVRPRSKWARYRPHIDRPLADQPGALVQVDTIHFVRRDDTRWYIYTLIDVCSRFAYAEYTPRYSQKLSLEFVLRAQTKAGFSFQMIQTDNGPEFGKWFGDELGYQDIHLRHSRVRTPNDNAHLERLNRTLQEEGLKRLQVEAGVQTKIDDYLDYYNNERLHLGIDCQTPAEVVRSY